MKSLLRMMEVREILRFWGVDICCQYHVIHSLRIHLVNWVSSHRPLIIQPNETQIQESLLAKERKTRSESTVPDRLNESLLYKSCMHPSSSIMIVVVWRKESQPHATPPLLFLMMIPSSRLADLNTVVLLLALHILFIQRSSPSSSSNCCW